MKTKSYWGVILGLVLALSLPPISALAARYNDACDRLADMNAELSGSVLGGSSTFVQRTAATTAENDGEIVSIPSAAAIPTTPADESAPADHADEAVPADPADEDHSGPSDVVDFLTFRSDAPFTLATANADRNWNGTLYSSTDAETWEVWDGMAVLASGADNALYLCGTDNTVITGYVWAESVGWQFPTGSGVACTGNIESLLDCRLVALGEHPEMDECCFGGMFEGCTALTAAPELPAATLTGWCYSGMFKDCTALTAAPALPATELAAWCYSGMFEGCTALTAAPALPAAKLADGCYLSMFFGCTALTAAPELPAATLTDGCYNCMFEGCSTLTAAPALPAVTLASDCYNSMFRNCTALASAPELPAATLARDCYEAMFESCTALTAAPALPATELASDCYNSMFRGCTALTAVPALPASTLADGCYRMMFRDCCNIKLSTEQTDNFQIAYRIPAAGTRAKDALTDMFSFSGGLFTGTPAYNATYYLHSSNSIVE